MKIALLNTPRSGHKIDLLERYEALYCGGDEWHEHVEHWIPKNAQEPDPLWAERRARATYTNHAGPICDMIAGWLFSEPASLTGEAGAIEGWSSDVDRQGSSWSSWWRAAFTEALVQREVYAWVNLPRAPETPLASRAEQERAGLLRPYLVEIDADDVVDWDDDETGGLRWIIVRDVEETRGSVEEARTKTWRWRYIDAQVIRTWTWKATAEKPAPTGDDEAMEGDQITHGYGLIPVARLRLSEGLWAMSKLHDPVVGHTRAENDLDWALHRAAHSLLVMTTRDGAAKPTLGPGYYLQVWRDDQGEDKVSYAEPTGASFTVMAERVEKRREEIYRVVQQLALAASSGDAPAKLSGASKAMDWQAMQVMLVAYADLVLAAMRATLRIVEAASRTNAGTLSVSGLEGWQREDLTAYIDQLVQALPAVPSPTFKRAAAKGLAVRLLPDATAEDLAQVAKELDAADFETPAPYAPPPRPPAA